MTCINVKTKGWNRQMERHETNVLLLATRCSEHDKKYRTERTVVIGSRVWRLQKGGLS